MVGYRDASVSMTSGAYSVNQDRCRAAGSQVRITTGPRVTRRTSRSPAARSGHWWRVNDGSGAWKLRSSKGGFWGGAPPAGVNHSGRCARMDPLGSTAVTRAVVGSYEPAPAPTFN